MRQFKLLRGESFLLENHDTHLTAHTINHVTMFGTSSLNEPNIESNNEMQRWYNERFYNESMQLSVESAQRRTEQRQLELRQIEENAQRIFINDTRITYKLTLWNRLKTWWKYSMNKDEKLNFCLLMGLLFAIFSMLGYIVYVDIMITEQISKMK